MSTGEWLIRLTAWLAFAAWSVASAMMVRGAARFRRPSTIDWLWLTGAVVMLIHTACAFHFRHAWSHAAALADTARQTQDLTGLDWGGGLWLNYLVVIVWLVDAGSRLMTPTAHARRPRWLTVATHGFLGFIWFNATVVFGSLWMRFTGTVMFVGLAGLLVQSLGHSRRSRAEERST